LTFYSLEFEKIEKIQTIYYVHYIHQGDHDLVIKKDINEIIKWYYSLKKDWPTDDIQRMIFKYKLYEASFLSQVLAMI
jgi:hypothetical protein